MQVRNGEVVKGRVDDVEDRELHEKPYHQVLLTLEDGTVASVYVSERKRRPCIGDRIQTKMILDNPFWMGGVLHFTASSWKILKKSPTEFITTDLVSESLRRVLKEFPQLWKCGVRTLPELLNIAAQRIFLHQLPEDDDVRVIRRALMNVTRYGVINDSDVP